MVIFLNKTVIFRLKDVQKQQSCVKKSLLSSLLVVDKKKCTISYESLSQELCDRLEIMEGRVLVIGL